MKNIVEDLEARSAFRKQVRELIEAEIKRRQSDFIVTEGDDSFSMAAIRAAVILEANNVN